MCYTLSDERMGLLFTIAAGPRHRTHSLTTFYCLMFETPPTWRARFPYLYTQEQGGQLYPQALGSLFVASYELQDYGGGI
jgi:hypothetical protein